MTNPPPRQPLRQGEVWKMPLVGLSSAEPHFLIVLNHNHVAGKAILLSIITSQVQKRLAYARSTGKPPATIVQFGPNQYAELDRHSCVDCNSVKLVDASYFSQSASSPHSRPCSDIPAPLLKRIIAGVLASPDVSDNLKALVRPQP